MESGGGLADLRRDAWGHGVTAVYAALRDAGAEAVLLDEGTASAHELSGLRVVEDGEPDIDSHLLYGLPDGDGVRRTPAALRLMGRVLSTKILRAGEAVSYGYIHRATVDTTVALVTGGYAQGIIRSLGNRGFVDIAGDARRIVGRVAMDVCVVDLGGADVPVGTPVTFFGGTGAAADALVQWSALTTLTPAELLVVAATHAIREEEA